MTSTLKNIQLPVLICMLLLSSALNTRAQNKPYNEEITVIATFNPIIPDAFKIGSNPVINDTTTTVPVMSYVIRPTDARIQLGIEALPAVKLIAEPLPKIYRNYIKAGVGNYSTLYGELFASSLRSKTHLLGFHAKHFSANGKISGYAPTTNSSQLAELYGERYLENHTLSGNIFFNREGLHLYGYHNEDYPDTIITKSDIKQRYLIGGGEVTLGSRYKSSDKLNHAFGFNYTHLSDKYKARENEYLITANLDKKFDLFHWDTDQTLGIVTSLKLMNQKDSTGKENSGILRINPFLKAEYNEYSFKAGIGFYVGMDSVTKAHIYPQLEARLDLIPGALQIYAGIDGGMERTTLHTLISENPYISSELPLGFTYNKFKAFGGFNSNISRSFNFNASIQSSTVENYAFFITDTLSFLKNSFSLLYDDISFMQIKAELEYVRTEKLKISLSGSYYDYYKLGDQEHPWYKPTYELGFNTTYNMQDKIIFRLRTTYHGPVYALATEIDANTDAASTNMLISKKLEGWIDLNLGAEYKFNKALSFWVNFNNLANGQHYYWYNYPSYRFNLMGGLSYSF